MDFEFDDDHRMLQEQVRTFAQKEVAPGAEERDETAEMPPELHEKLAEMGFFGIAIPEEYGGAGMGCVASTIVVDEVSRACGGTGVYLSAHNSLCVDPIMLFGSEEQKAKYLPGLASGETVGCLSLTEPGAGSDAGAAACRAVLKDDGWHIEGSKNFVTNGKQAGVMVLIALTDPDDARHRLSAFIVEKPTPGLRIGKLEKKLGIRCSSTAELVFEDCVIPKDALLGKRGLGMRMALTTLDGGRVGIAAQALGIAQACLDQAASYAGTRVQFGRPIGKFQAIQNKLADMATEIAAARLLTYRAAWLKDQGQPYEFGGYGYCRDYPVERYLRDAKITELYEGTSEIHRLVIARGLAT